MSFGRSQYNSEYQDDFNFKSYSNDNLGATNPPIYKRTPGRYNLENAIKMEASPLDVHHPDPFQHGVLSLRGYGADPANPPLTSNYDSSFDNIHNALKAEAAALDAREQDLIAREVKVKEREDFYSKQDKGLDAISKAQKGLKELLQKEVRVMMEEEREKETMPKPKPKQYIDLMRERQQKQVREGEITKVRTETEAMVELLSDNL